MTLIVEEIRDHVAIWRMDHPPVNALSPDLLEALQAHLDNHEANPTVRAVVITGQGSVFSGGADLNAALMSGVDISHFMRMGAAVLARLEKSRLPIVAAVNGPAYGGGNELAMACDIRVASWRARFGQPEVGLGIIPGWGGTRRLVRLVGESPARKMLLTGDSISAEFAYQIGLVDEVVDPGLLLETALNVADRLASVSPLAIAAIKELLAPQEPARQEAETEAIGRLAMSEDALEGVRAFLGHRRPRFSGR